MRPHAAGATHAAPPPPLHAPPPLAPPRRPALDNPTGGLAASGRELAGEIEFRRSRGEETPTVICGARASCHIVKIDDMARLSLGNPGKLQPHGRGRPRRSGVRALGGELGERRRRSRRRSAQGPRSGPARGGGDRPAVAPARPHGAGVGRGMAARGAAGVRQVGVEGLAELCLFSVVVSAFGRRPRGRNRPNELFDSDIRPEILRSATTILHSRRPSDSFSSCPYSRRRGPSEHEADERSRQERREPRPRVQRLRHVP